MGELSRNIKGIESKYESPLHKAGIQTLNDLRKMNVFHVDSRTRLGLARLKFWQSMAELQTIGGIDNQYAEGLVKSGIKDLGDLAARDAGTIHSELKKLENEGVLLKCPTRAKIRAWQGDAVEITTRYEERPSRLATEVDIVWEAMTCRGMRNYYESEVHACRWFHQYGPFYAYDVKDEDTLLVPEGYLNSFFVGKRYQIPEILSGCRKSPIMSIGLNPNLRAVTQPRRIYPYFDNIQQYAKHFRFRTNYKYSIEDHFYNSHLDPQTGKADFHGKESIPLHKEYVSMYNEYKNILRAFERQAGFGGNKLSLGEDVSYYNFVACHSPRWNMGVTEEEGIIEECFLIRQFFLKQFRQSAPKVAILFGKPMMKSFVKFFRNDFDEENIPDPDQTFSTILANNHYRMNLDGKQVRVIFSPHPTGAPYWYRSLEALSKIVEALKEEFNQGNLKYDTILEHLERSDGPCEFCSNGLFYLGECPYRKHEGWPPL